MKEPYDVDTETVCYSCRALAIVRRFDAHEHEKDDKAAGFAQPHHEDGRIYTVREMDPKELEEG